MKSQSVFPIPEMSDDWIKNELHKKFPPDKAEKMYCRVIATYEKFAREAPTIGGKANPMAKNFYGALSVFAYYECMKRAMPPEDITAMCYGMMPGDKKGGELSRFDLNNKLVQKIFHGLFAPRARKLNKHKKDGSWNNTRGMKINGIPDNFLFFISRQS